VILVLGGTAESVPIAQALFEAGSQVLLSTATPLVPRAPLDPGIRLRAGPLDARGLEDLIRNQRIRALVDATHPYAAAASANAWTSCQKTGTPYVAFERPSALDGVADIHWAPDHDRAAILACSFGRPVLLTIGARNLAPYVAASRQSGVKLVARVLHLPSSVEACRRLGVEPEDIVCADGPFSVTENTLLIRRHRIGVLVTKDSGSAGGVATKVAAAKDCQCQVVAVQRPARPEPGHASIPALKRALRSRLESGSGLTSGSRPNTHPAT
jgi:precorrin-6A/cobalt-precorrin-6A reductase